MTELTERTDGACVPYLRSETRDLPQMPEVSRFHGIVIAMYYGEHPPSHFHAKYGENRIRVAIHDGQIMSGNFPNHAERHVLNWLELHRDELTGNWELAEERKPLKKIDPLE